MYLQIPSHSQSRVGKRKIQWLLKGRLVLFNWLNVQKMGKIHYYKEYKTDSSATVTATPAATILAAEPSSAEGQMSAPRPLVGISGREELGYWGAVPFWTQSHLSFFRLEYAVQA